jgi:hypothetical protein
MLKSIDEIVAANVSAGGFWFSEETMRFFDSKVYEHVTPVEDGAYFVTSEQAPRSGDYFPARLFSVRRAYDNGKIVTVGGFQAYSTLSDALVAVTQLVEGE